MRSFFNVEGPFIRGLTKFADLMILNLLALVCSLPIITIGASYTALHYVCLKLVRNEETYVFKMFFRSFKENFKQATILWLIQLVIMGILGTDIWLGMGENGNMPTWVLLIVVVASLFVLLVYSFVYPVLARYVYTVPQILKTSLALAIAYFPRTICMVILIIAPPIIGYKILYVLPVVVLLGISLPAFLCAFLYDKPFKRMEENGKKNGTLVEEENEDEHIFSDEQMELNTPSDEDK